MSKGLTCVSKQQPVAQSSKGSNTWMGCINKQPGVNPVTYLHLEHGVYAPMLGAALDAQNTVETSVLLRHTFLLALAAWNSITPWSPTAKATDYAPGFGLPAPKRKAPNPPQEIIERNTAVAYALQRVFEATLPAAAKQTAEQMVLMDLDPNYTGYSDLSKPADIGNAYAYATLEAWSNYDGYNQLGTEVPDAEGNLQQGVYGSDVYPRNYSDFTGFMASNDPYHLKYINKWQPQLESDGQGYFSIQTHTTPQAGWAKPWALTREQLGKEFLAPPPWPPVKSREFLKVYKKEVDLIIKASANLTDWQKMVAEHFDNKLFSYGALTYGIYLQKFNWTLTQAIHYDLYLGTVYDATLVSWRNKIIHNAIRPVSAVRYLYGATNITAYRGPGKGTGIIPGSKWSSYLRTMPHSEFLSGSSCICSAFAEYNALYLGSEQFDYVFPFRTGCSVRERNITPRQSLLLDLPTKKEFLKVCADSRLWAGVHFQRTIDTSVKVCKDIGAYGYRKVAALW
eukprot:CAMPEP_0202920818 /NCGR_PEP_ID=MMETSP1392-20130828/77039_1 /ASSEMBLY_ACC=CAM_ASM_000868 /TAXON_ID=225041 /ORGANISM="Chlamydomonas chlamydogama, Strain SAG 11-48b" /LENGTH=509 /DNA_ID=CAMNT_0049614331 /DNA_START=245 /DNA_END=1775 /DNA_ORIENTATION=+